MKALYCTLFAAAVACNATTTFVLSDGQQIISTVITGAVALGSAAGFFMLRSGRGGRAGRPGREA